MPEKRQLNSKGEMDYDYSNDILFFKSKNREYSRSKEFSNIVLDIDKEDFIVGIQIFDASKFLRIPKIALRNVPKWQFQATILDNKIEIRLVFQVVYRNKRIEKNPIIMTETEDNLPNSRLIAVEA
ncbi:MAG: DUF2283 domain-containing protein [Candidatus Aenigmarchaeota archaeon]|nr:DUF2283 domain-containing protein [Candidatus Aenigmarchaeota archaeon]